MSLTLRELAELAGAESIGDGARAFRGVAALESATATDVALFHHPRYRQAFEQTHAGAVVVGKKSAADRPDSPALLIAADPALAFAKISVALQPARARPSGVDAQASVDATAKVHPTAFVGAFACVGAGAQIGPGTQLAPFSFVGPRAQLGRDCELQAGAVVAHGCILGDRVRLHPGAVVGADGFGYAFDAARPEHLKVPQIGIARIEDDVEIGANSCVDRATLGETVIGRGTKIDNLVQVAHNVRVGPLSILCAQVGVAGSATLGQGVVLGGQVGVVGHLTVGDGAKVGAGSGLMEDVLPGETKSGAPAVPHAQWLRTVALERRLPELLLRIAELEKQVKALSGPAAFVDRTLSKP